MSDIMEELFKHFDIYNSEFLDERTVVSAVYVIKEAIKKINGNDLKSVEDRVLFDLQNSIDRIRKNISEQRWEMIKQKVDQELENDSEFVNNYNNLKSFRKGI